MSSDPLRQQVPYEVSAPRYSVSHQMVTTAFELPGYHVTQNLGIVRGIVVRSRSLITNIGALMQTVEVYNPTSCIITAAVIVASSIIFAALILRKRQ